MTRDAAVVDWGWLEHAACRGSSAGLFFPAEGDKCRQDSERYLAAAAAAKAVCAACPVRQECLETALATGDAGIWGGTSLQERNRILRQRTNNRKGR